MRRRQKPCCLATHPWWPFHHQCQRSEFQCSTPAAQQQQQQQKPLSNHNSSSLQIVDRSFATKFLGRFSRSQRSLEIRLRLHSRLHCLQQIQVCCVIPMHDRANFQHQNRWNFRQIGCLRFVGLRSVARLFGIFVGIIDLLHDEGERLLWAIVAYDGHGQCIEECRRDDWQTHIDIQSYSTGCHHTRTYRNYLWCCCIGVNSAVASCVLPSFSTLWTLKGHTPVQYISFHQSNMSSVMIPRTISLAKQMLAHIEHLLPSNGGDLVRDFSVWLNDVLFGGVLRRQSLVKCVECIANMNIIPIICFIPNNFPSFTQ